ncbi:Kinase D-interacting substrate of 220 kDa [Rhizoctonia solani]|nr:Kinase D-interacting substrate of 220 kDa [Rhizoctonia solani]
MQTLGESVNVQDPQVWQHALLALDALAAEGRVPDTNQANRESEIAKYRNGYGVLWFAGTGSIQGVVQLDQDPNQRSNPRPLSEEHLLELTNVFATKGVVDDRRTPIRIKAPPQGLPKNLLASMKAVNINDSSSPIPTLELIREHPDVETRLECEIFALSDGKQLLSDSEVMERKAELNRLRALRQLATLINGNHRINAMIAVGKSLEDAALHIATCERNQVDGFDAKAEWDRLMKSLKSATYVVEVFAYDTPPHVLAWLSENEQARPQYSPLAGEAVWCLVENQKTVAQVMIDNGQATDREDAIAQLNKLSDCKETSVGITPGESELLSRLATLPMNRRGTSLGDKECISLMSCPTTLEMAYDTRAALCVYNRRINNSHAKAMLNDHGAALTAFTWLGARLLIQITNTSLGIGLEDAENFVASIDPETIDSKGLVQARVHYSNLTSNPQEIPALLSLWEPDGHSLFEKSATEHIYDAGFSLCKPDCNDPKFVTQVRRMYLGFGKSMIHGCNGNERARRFGTAASLYALLPLWTIGTIANEQFFYPAAILPSKTTYSAYEKMVKSTGESLGGWMLEYLMDQYQLPWTAGSSSVGSSRQSANWWGRLPGEHQILLRCFRNSRLGSVDARLSTALEMLEDPRFTEAIKQIDGAMTGEKPNQKLAAGTDAQSLRVACHAMKCGKASFPILSNIIPRIGNCHGTHSQMQEKLREARKGVKAFLFGTETSVDDLYSAHPVLSIIPKVYFVNSKIQEWALGWNDDSKKMMGTATSCMGWFLVSEELRLSIMPAVATKLPASRFLFYVSRWLDTLEDKEPWWHNIPGLIENSPTMNKARVARPVLHRPESPIKRKGSRRGNVTSKSTSTVLPPNSSVCSTAPLAISATNRAITSLEPTTLVKPSRPGAQSSSKDGSQAVSDHAPPAPRSDTDDLQPKRTRRPRTTISQEIIQDDKEHEVEEEDELPAPERVLSSSHSLNSRREHVPPLDSNQTTKEHSRFAQQSAKEFPVSSSKHRSSLLKPGMLPVLDSVSYSDTINPGHVLLGNHSLVEHGLDISFACQRHIDAPEEAAEEDQERITDDMELVIKDIMEERQRLRKSLMALLEMSTKTLEEFPYAAEYTVSMLPHSVQMCKDAFVSRVAEILAQGYSEPGYKPGTGMLDALAMVASDGLYTNELFHIDSGGFLHYHTGSTYPKGIQPYLTASELATTFKSPVGGGDPATLHDAWQRMSHFIPIHGYGRNTAETVNRGVDGLFAIIANEKLSSGLDSQVLAAPATVADDQPMGDADTSIPDLNFIRTRIRNLLTDGDLLRKEGIFELVPCESHLIVDGYRPAISTAIYDAYVPPGASTKIARDAKKFQTEAHQIWMSTVKSNMESSPPSQPGQEGKPKQPEDSRHNHAYATSLRSQVPRKAIEPRISLGQPRGGLKLMDRASAQSFPGSRSPIDARSVFAPSQLVGNSGLLASPSFTSAQPPRRFRSTTPATPDRTQRMPQDEEISDSELEIKDFLRDSVMRDTGYGDTGYESQEHISECGESDSSSVDTNRYQGLGKRGRSPSMQRSPELIRKSSRL